MKKYWIAIVASLAVLIVVIGASMVMVKKVHTQKIIPSAFAGLPQTLEDLDAWYGEPPVGQNAATFELQGIKAMQITGVEKIPDLPILGNAPPPPLSEPLSPGMKSALAAFLQRNHDALQFFNQGTPYDQSRYPIDLTKGPDTLLPHLAGIKRGLQMEEMAAILDSENNEGQRAAEDVLDGMGLAHSLEAEPVLISQLVRAAGVVLTTVALEQVLNRTSLSAESLDKLANVFQSMAADDEKGIGFDRAMVGEAVSDAALLSNRNDLVAGFSTSLSAQQLRQMTDYINTTGNLKKERDYLETTLDQLLSARQEAFPARLKDANDVIQQRAAGAGSRGLLINVMFWNGFGNTTIREARCLANLRLAMTAVALEQFREARGNYPDSLAELTPVYLAKTPMDPFDGKLLRFRKQGAGYMLYSLGDGLKDYSGRQLSGGRGNIPFSVLNPPK